MKIVLVLSYLICTILAQSQSVIQLDDATFEEYHKKHDLILVYFHAVWSNDSNFLKAQFYRLPSIVISDKDLIFGETTSKNYIINHKYDIQTYPSIVLINKEKYYKYKGEITTNAIKDWIEM